MKKQNEDKVPAVEKDGWEAEKLAEEATNIEDEEIVQQMKNGKGGEKVPDKLKVAPTDEEGNEDSLHGRGTYNNDEEE